MEEPPTMFDDIDTLLDVKTLGPGLAYKRGTRNTSDNLNPVEYRQEDSRKSTSNTMLKLLVLIINTTTLPEERKDGYPIDLTHMAGMEK
jgi:hypothetical protein